jgi:hypothetical protein
MNKKIAEVGLSHVPCPSRQNRVTIYSVICNWRFASWGNFHTEPFSPLATASLRATIFCRLILLPLWSPNQLASSFHVTSKMADFVARRHFGIARHLVAQARKNCCAPSLDHHSILYRKIKLPWLGLPVHCSTNWAIEVPWFSVSFLHHFSDQLIILTSFPYIVVHVVFGPIFKN